MFGIRTALKKVAQLEKEMGELNFILNNPAPYKVGDKIENVDLIVIERKIDFGIVPPSSGEFCLGKIKRCWLYKAVYTQGENKGQIVEFFNKFDK